MGISSDTKILPSGLDRESVVTKSRTDNRREVDENDLGQVPFRRPGLPVPGKTRWRVTP